jgi:hypothetical protein
MAAGLNLANKPDSAKLGEAELTIDYTIPELIHSIELVQRQIRIQWPTIHKRGAPP